MLWVGSACLLFEAGSCQWGIVSSCVGVVAEMHCGVVLLAAYLCNGYVVASPCLSVVVLLVVYLVMVSRRRQKVALTSMPKRNVRQVQDCVSRHAKVVAGEVACTLRLGQLVSLYQLEDC